MEPIFAVAVDKNRNQEVRSYAMDRLAVLILRLYQNDRQHFDIKMPPVFAKIRKYLSTEKSGWIIYASETNIFAISTINSTNCDAFAILMYFDPDTKKTIELMNNVLDIENNPAMIYIFYHENAIDRWAVKERPQQALLDYLTRYEKSPNILLSYSASEIIESYRGKNLSSAENFKRIASLQTVDCGLRRVALSFFMSSMPADTMYIRAEQERIYKSIKQDCIVNGGDQKVYKVGNNGLQ